MARKTVSELIISTIVDSLLGKRSVRKLEDRLELFINGK